MSRLAAFALLAAVGVAGCQPAPEAISDPDLQLLSDLEAAHRPYFDCVNKALSGRPDFAGRLPDLVVDAGLAPALQALHGKYLDGGRDLSGEARPAQILATQEALLALAAYGGGAADAGEPAPARVRRTMAMAHTMATIADATDVDCAPSPNLTRLLKKAEDDHF